MVHDKAGRVGNFKPAVICGRVSLEPRLQVIAPKSISSFIVTIANAKGAPRIINYLDDFLIISPSYDECIRQRDIVTSVISHLGFGVSWPKVTLPNQVTTFLGITIDSVNLELSLPMEKVKKLQDLLFLLINRGTATKKELECVGGLVSHCAYIVMGGWTFSRRIFFIYQHLTPAIPRRFPGPGRFWLILNGGKPFATCSTAGPA